ncbi:hypothetical protein P7K49_033642 [Saguinus oedipus]|uniref:Uncharacterized protein n=1 Tax=Saguinus oedipus TaxID=9490 RepID=A0ABQ9TTA7_SAGOE|nr:hypothetical protein P7K49_033642 [Saguinus oedipus]
MEQPRKAVVVTGAGAAPGGRGRAGQEPRAAQGSWKVEEKEPRGSQGAGVGGPHKCPARRRPFWRPSLPGPDLSSLPFPSHCWLRPALVWAAPPRQEQAPGLSQVS